MTVDKNKVMNSTPPAPHQETALEPIALENAARESQLLLANGNPSDLEDHLINQMVILQRIFEVYTQKMISNKHPEYQKIFGSLALRAQNQSRKTIATLVELKNPKKLTFIKQQNNAQINLNQKNDKQTIESGSE